MCSIFGIYDPRGEFNSATRAVILRLLTIAGRSRGMDSAGYRTSEGVLVRKVGDPLNLLEDIRPQAMKGWSIIGHTRAASQGDVSVRNAHPVPLPYGGAIVHNGHVTHPPDEEIGFVPEGETDTERLGAALQIHGMRWTTTRFSGWAAIAMQEDSRLLMWASNAPLHYQAPEDLRWLIFASTPGMLATLRTALPLREPIRSLDKQWLELRPGKTPDSGRWAMPMSSSPMSRRLFHLTQGGSYE